MGRRVEEIIEVKHEIRSAPACVGGAERDADHGAAYRQARANVLEASLYGLVRLRVVA